MNSQFLSQTNHVDGVTVPLYDLPAGLHVDDIDTFREHVDILMLFRHVHTTSIAATTSEDSVSGSIAAILGGA